MEPQKNPGQVKSHSCQKPWATMTITAENARGIVQKILAFRDLWRCLIEHGDPEDQKRHTQWGYNIISIINGSINGEAREWGDGFNEKTWFLPPFPNMSQYSVPDATDSRSG